MILRMVHKSNTSMILRMVNNSNTSMILRMVRLTSPLVETYTSARWLNSF
jgi:hypothetical protein